MTRSIRRALVLGAAVSLLAIGAASATPGAGATGSVVARGTLEAGDKIRNSHLKLKIREDIDIVTQTITITPGGHTGWHSHPGPVLVTIAAGAMTFYDGDDPSCSPVVFGTGDSFIDEGGGHVHIARNEGAADLVLYATYLLPVGAPLRTDQAAPGNCAF